MYIIDMEEIPMYIFRRDLKKYLDLLEGGERLIVRGVRLCTWRDDINVGQGPKQVPQEYETKVSKNGKTITGKPKEKWTGPMFKNKNLNK